MRKFKVRLKKSDKKKRNSGAPKQISYKKTISILLPLLIAACALAGLYCLYAKSPSFIVKNVIVLGKDPASSVNYTDLEKMLIDKNIFSVSLREVRKYMLDNYPELGSLHIKRAFPDSVIATAVLRKAVAQLFQVYYYPVDAEGVILSGVKERPEEGLPIITGARLNLSREVGKATDSRRVNNALSLLSQLERSGLLDGHMLVEIDVSNLRNVIFFLEDGLEVKIGREDFASRLKTLNEILSDPKLRPSDIRYIDLRFKEPVMGPKWRR